MNPKNHHTRLVLSGPVEVRREILEAQTQWMIGHRSPEFADLFARLQTKLKKVFLTESRVYLLGGSGSGFWEAAARNCIRDNKKALHLTGGAFGERWAQVSQANGKQVDTLAVDWGQGHTPEMVAEALEKETYDAVCVTHNETSTGVMNPLKAIAEVVHQYDDTLLLVDAVSSFLGTELRVDDWGIDVALTSSQKALSMPPGLAFGAVSDKALARAEEIEYRGYFFDFLTLEKSLVKNNTPATPPVSLMFAADQQLDDILSEGLENRWARHRQMRDRTHQWVVDREFGFYAQDGFRSDTVTAVLNLREIDVVEWDNFMREYNYTVDKGYGKIRGKTFRIPHMGDMQMATLEEVLALIDAFMAR